MVVKNDVLELNKMTDIDRTRVIDFHMHVFPEKIAAGAISKLAAISGITPATNGTAAGTALCLKKCDIGRGVCLNIATSPRQQRAVNDGAFEVKREYKEVFLPFGSVHFEAEDAISELSRIKELGLFGVKLHPDYQGFMIDDKRLYPIYEAISALALPVIFHAGYDCISPELIHAPPKSSARVLRDFPRLKMVLAHFGGLNRWDEVESELLGKDVWLDTAMCATYADKAQIARMLNKHDRERVLFGSDCPWENPLQSLRFVMEMGLDQAALEQVLYKNAESLLSL